MRVDDAETDWNLLQIERASELIAQVVPDDEVSDLSWRRQMSETNFLEDTEYHTYTLQTSEPSFLEYSLLYFSDHHILLSKFR